MRTFVMLAALSLAACSSAEPVFENTTAEAPIVNDSPPVENGTAFDVPADPNARYSLLSVTPGQNGHIIALTRRTGTSGTSYSNREIDCDAQLARYVGEGDTREDAERPSPNPGDMAPLVAGSSTHTAVQVACAKR
ncbi:MULTISPECIES: hypothetical protein [Sphingomonas]|uniref:hypothetical protein n=1 Tax=Sphingomonas TaxID=13687 RepID=UPI000F7EDC19|nr:hypothetical protein [Sphingomonas sp. ABOLF]GLK19255.1 hypothetical protein GCM10017606_00810 [Microbacterium terregens]